MSVIRNIKRKLNRLQQAANKNKVGSKDVDILIKKITDQIDTYYGVLMENRCLREDNGYKQILRGLERFRNSKDADQLNNISFLFPWCVGVERQILRDQFKMQENKLTKLRSSMLSNLEVLQGLI